jgi:hypothetical protein
MQQRPHRRNGAREPRVGLIRSETSWSILELSRAAPLRRSGGKHGVSRLHRCVQLSPSPTDLIATRTSAGIFMTSRFVCQALRGWLDCFGFVESTFPRPPSIPFSPGKVVQSCEIISGVAASRENAAILHPKKSAARCRGAATGYDQPRPGCVTRTSDVIPPRQCARRGLCRRCR